MIRLFTGCANIIPPGGGAKDTIPPRLMYATPKDSSTQTFTNKIVLNFNEYVEAKEIQGNLIVSPLLKFTPQVDYKLQTVTIKLKDTLEPNTTYAFNFGNAIKDINEGNIAKNFSYVFSTGKTLDKGNLFGKVLLAEKGKVDSTLIVVLYKNLADTAVVKTNPKYYTKLDSKGNFAFHYLPYDTFNAFVMENGYDKRYNDSTKLFAFLNQPIVINDTAKSIMFYAFQEAQKKETVKPGNTVPIKIGGKSANTNKLKYLIQLDNNQQDLLTELALEFNNKLKSIDTSKIIITDTLYKRTKNVLVQIDSTKQRLLINVAWKEDTHYYCIIAKDAVTDTANNTLAKADTIKFVTKKEADYGSLKIRFPAIEINKNPVVQFFDNDKLIFAETLTRNEFIKKLMKPGEYELRILYDENKNGVWDTGNYKLKKQPEIVQAIAKKIKIRNNWDNEVTINLQ